MTLNHHKLAGIATQPTNCEMTTHRMPGGYYVAMELTDDGRGNSVKTSWMFRHPAEVTEFLTALESTVAVARQEFPAVVDRAEAAPATVVDVSAESSFPANGSETRPHADDPCDDDGFNMPSAVHIESGPELEGFFATLLIYDRVGAISIRSLSFETKNEILGFFDSIRDSVAQAEHEVEDAVHRLRRAGDSGNQ